MAGKFETRSERVRDRLSARSDVGLGILRVRRGLVCVRHILLPKLLPRRFHFPSVLRAVEGYSTVLGGDAVLRESKKPKGEIVIRVIRQKEFRTRYG